MFRRTRICDGVLLIGVVLAQSSFAQDAAPQRVEILGSSIKRISKESDAPIQTLTREDIARSGANSVEELMKSVTAASSNNSSVAASASGNTTGGISTISLRGLGASRTLVLVNGLRTAPYGSPDDSVGVDVGSLPLAAIECVEILKEGAGAIYGSDAIAGVVNFVLRKDFVGTEVSAQGGFSYDGKGRESRGSLLHGFSFDGGKGNATVLITAEHDLPLYGRDRPFARATIRPDKDNNGASSNTDPANFVFPRSSNTSGVANPRVPAIRVPDPNNPGGYTLAYAGAPGTTPDCGIHAVYNAAFGATKCLYDPAPDVSLEPDIKRVGGMASAHYQVSDDLRVRADFSLNDKKQFVSIQPAPLSANLQIPFILTTANPNYPTGFVKGITGGATPDLSLNYRPFIVGNRSWTDEAINTRASLGADGVLNTWDYSANLLYSRSKLTETLDSGYFNVNGSATTGPGIEDLLNGNVKDDSGHTLWVNPFGSNSDAVLAAARAADYRGAAFKTTTGLIDGQLKFSRDEFFELPAGNVAVAFGTELRRESFKLDSSAALASGDISGYSGNFPSFDRSRSVISVFAELLAPVAAGLDLDGAVRYDRYGATTNPNRLDQAATALGQLSSYPAGDTLSSPTVDQISRQSVVNANSFGQATGKLGAKWVLGRHLLLRSSVSTGFRAPSLLELYQPLQSGATAYVNDPARCNAEASSGGLDCAAQFNTYSGGNGSLKPERSLTFTLGSVIEATRDVSFAVDYFHTRVKDEITALGVGYLFSHEAQYPSYVRRGPADGIGTAGAIIAIDQRQINIAEVIVSGVDFDLQGATDTSAGRFGLGIDGTWQTAWDSVNPDGSKFSSIGKTSSTTPGVIPRLRLSNRFTYRTPGRQLEGTLAYHWQSGLTDLCGSLDQDDLGNCGTGHVPPHVSAYGTADLQVKWEPGRLFTGTLGVKNFLNTQPPYVNGSGGAFQGGYDPTYVDPHGRFWYSSATLRF